MPEAMSSAPPGTPYRHFWKPGDPYNDIYTGWTYRRRTTRSGASSATRDQPYFDGFRDLATNGIDKPVLNVFRMLGRMSGDRVAAESSAGLSLESVRDAGVAGVADIAALASRSARSASVLVFNYHDDDLPAPDATIDLTIEGLPNGRAVLTHYRVDATHSNSYERWKAMGSPQAPTPSQYAELEKAGQLEELHPAKPVDIANGRFVQTFSLPRQGVSLVHVAW